ncbi:phosphopantetheine-binding protein, partial [Azospirillum sp. B506]|uniref:phosphopantetheine-binding protein n=1 Tax=Azospirillum sp. B506 TaxID=137721 RepID=UPI0005B2C4F4
RRALDTTFLSCGQWEDQLRLAGAATVLRFPGDGGAMSDVGQHVFAAQFKPDRMAIPAADLRRHAGERLPEHMVPAEIHILDSLPMTENGKIDRKALAGVAPKSRQAAAAAGSMPRDDLEREIAAVWASVLRLDAVGLDQNFFDLGGDSLLVAQVVGRLRECLPKAAGLEWDVLLRRLLNQPTVAALADLLRGAGGPAGGGAVYDGPADDGLSLIELGQGDGTGATLLFVHDGSGTIVPYRSLLDRPHGNARRILGVAIQDPAPFLAMDPAGAISELADGHSGRIAGALSPGERLHIVGYCLGGLLATEIAQRLAQRGVTVERLSVISSYRVPFLIEDDILAEYVFARVMRADPAALGYPADEAGMRRLIADALARTPGPGCARLAGNGRR